MKRTAESNAKRSESMKRVWAERKAKAEHDAIHSVHPRFKRTFWDKLMAWFGGAA